MLMSVLALIGICAFFTLWLAMLTWGVATFTRESRNDRDKLRGEVEEVRLATERIEKNTKAVEKAVVPEAAIP